MPRITRRRGRVERPRGQRPESGGDRAAPIMRPGPAPAARDDGPTGYFDEPRSELEILLGCYGIGIERR